MEKIIETHSKETRTFESLETAKNHLKRLLRGKKFLLVLDDMWNEKQEEWDKLKASLNFEAFGSSILVTTRGTDVASTVRAHVQHKIEVLSKDQCWQVFKVSACLEEDQENGKLEVIGKQIAEKCGGLPLAAKSLGGSLRSTRDVPEWEYIRDSHIWELQETSDILPVLVLSLGRLESHSRNCFTFCGVFPKGYHMHREELIQLWMANDLVPSHLRLGPEYMGNKNFNDLVLKSFFQVSSAYNRVTMHDLMHDLAFSIGNKGFCWDEDRDVSEVPSGIVHLSWYPSRTINIGNAFDTLSKYLPSIRTFILNYRSEIFDPREIITFENLNCLRALHLSPVHKLLASMGKIKHLKYLSLSGYDESAITHLPDSICTLTNLQTLKVLEIPGLTQLPDGIGRLVHLRNLYLRGCSHLTHLPNGIVGLVNLRCLKIMHCGELTHLPDGIELLTNLQRLDLDNDSSLKKLPDGISQLVNLEHLYIWYCVKLTHLPNRIGQLVNLQTLGLFVVEEQIGRRITELQGMNQLSGRLEIRGLEHVSDRWEAESAFLKNKKNLSSLELIWGNSQVSNNILDEAKAEGVLEALQPPQSLNEKLVIEGYGGSVFASWLRLLENLVRIELWDCSNCKCLPPVGQLPLLKFLVISGMKSLECIDTELYGISKSSSERHAVFPSLEELKFEDMTNLKEWQDLEIVKDNQQTAPCPCLKQLELSRCPNLVSLPSLILSFVQKLKIDHCSKVIVRSLPRLTSLGLKEEVTNGVTSFPNGSLQNLDVLKKLKILDYSELTSLPDELSNAISLKKLVIWSCLALQCVPVMMSSIVKVNISGCHSLNSLSQSLKYRATLESLEIYDCDQLELSSEDFQGLISLQTLHIVDLPKLTSLPRLQHLSTLKTLHIWRCKNLIRLWPHDGNNLTALETLSIEGCEQLELLGADFQHLIKLQSISLVSLPELRSLPELHLLHSLETLQINHCKNLRVLPQGLQNLTSLEVLLIIRCHSDLHSRCNKETGEYWPSIKHIPECYTEVDSVLIFRRLFLSRKTFKIPKNKMKKKKRKFPVEF